MFSPYSCNTILHFFVRAFSHHVQSIFTRTTAPALANLSWPPSSTFLDCFLPFVVSLLAPLQTDTACGLLHKYVREHQDTTRVFTECVDTTRSTRVYSTSLTFISSVMYQKHEKNPQNTHVNSLSPLPSTTVECPENTPGGGDF